jgi:ribonuclease R
VTEWGIYVEIIENKCEGMQNQDIRDDYYIPLMKVFHILTGFQENYYN